jgi:hypothetical protein
MVYKAKLQQVETKVNTFLLPDDVTRTINGRMFQTLATMQGVETRMDFEVWNGVHYDAIIGMEWLVQMDIKVGCFNCLMTETLPNGLPIYLIGMKPFPNTPLLSST